MFAAVAIVVYFAAVAVVMVGIFATGGGVSCETDCGTVADLGNDIAPWGMIAWIGVSLAVASAAVRRRAHAVRRREPSDKMSDESQ